MNQIYVQIQDLQKGDRWGRRVIDHVALFEDVTNAFVYFDDNLKPNPEIMSRYDEIMVGRDG